MRETHTHGHRGNGCNGHGGTWGHQAAKVKIQAGRRKAHSCPYCGQRDQVIPVYYGYPSDEMFMKAERGEVFLGGCAIAGYNARFYCKRDNTEF